jgi:ATP-binding cassette subfamily F protein uup
VGKTTLLKLCLGQLEPSEGTAVTGKRVKVNYIDQTRMALDGTGSLLDEISDGNEKLMFGNQPLGARNYLRRFLFDDKRINERVDLLSGGERARLMLAKVLKNGGNVIVLDEPTNDLDLPSLRMLEEALAVFDGTVIVVSHDRYFLDRICDQIIAFEDNGITVQTGNYSYYLEKRQAREAAERIQAQAAARDAAARQKAAVAAPVAKKGRKLTFKEKSELEGMESEILEVEQEGEALEALLHDPEFQAKRFAEIPEMVAKLDAVKAKAARLYTRWEELEALREQEG